MRTRPRLNEQVCGSDHDASDERKHAGKQHDVDDEFRHCTLPRYAAAARRHRCQAVPTTLRAVRRCVTGSVQ